MTITTETYCPCFPGFYNTVFEFDNEMIEQDIKEKIKENFGINIDNHNIDIYSLYDINYDSYKIDVSKEYCDYIESILSNFGVKIEYQTCYSPKEYNFANDSINCKITFDYDKVKDYLYANIDNFVKYLEKKYTSCDGFIPHYSTDVEKWLHNIDHTHCTGSIFEFIIDNENLIDDDCDVYYVIKDNICELEYITKQIDIPEIINIKDNNVLELINLLNKIKSDYNIYKELVKNESEKHKQLHKKNKLAIEKQILDILIENYKYNE